MRALAVAVGVSLVVNAVAIVWLRPSVAVAAEIVSEDDDSDVSPTNADEDREVVVELVDEPVAIATPAPDSTAASTALAPNSKPHAPDSTVLAPDSKPHATDSTAIAPDSTVLAPASTAIAPDSTSRTQDSTTSVRASDSTVRASDSSVAGSDGSAPGGTFVRTLDAILAPADASTGGAIPETGTKSKAMAMRGANLALTTQAVDAILSRPRPADATATKESPDPPDEAAELRHEITELDKRMMGPDLEKYASADEIDGMREDLESKRRDLEQMTIHPTGGGRYGAVHETYTASIEQDGTTHLSDRPNLRWHGLSLTFDVTDWAMRSSADDPYARAKMRFLDRTRPERIAIGTRYRAEQLAHAPQLMQANIERVWSTIHDPEARKDALFDLWDDCAEVGEPAVVQAGAAARVFVLGVIHARVTYSPADLVRLNARRHSTARFEP